MAKSKLSEIFIRRVDEIAAQLDGAKSAVFFQGLTPYMFRELAGHPSAVWGLADAIDAWAWIYLLSSKRAPLDA
mgnify:CR=1 FL=1